MAQAKKEIEPQPSAERVKPEVRGSPLAPSENKVYQKHPHSSCYRPVKLYSVMVEIWTKQH